MITREEALNRLTNTLQEMRAFYFDSKHISEDDEKDLVSMEMAIKALEQEPCEDCISREHLLEEIASLKESPWFKDDTNCAMAIRKEAIEIVEDLCIRKEPSINSQKIGHWIKYSIPRCGEQHYKCTSCGYYINFGQWGEFYSKEFKYCPNCGSRMEGAE